ncbi:hypothetical protein [Longimicrobium sp.]|uniref:hypothetical protein n=1 Tax=Longimicrobium sp. TaxID=2029185 RepID=UPI003B3BE6B5
MPRNRILPLIALLSLAAFPLRAQTPLAARMQAFLREIGDEPNTELAVFFPRRGDWTWVQTARDDNRGGVVKRIGVWRFSGAETPRVIGEDGPACSSFDVLRGGLGPFEGRFGMQARMNRGPWRRVRGTRFVPAGTSDDSPVIVEWRREDGVWVVSAFGDLDAYQPRVLGRPRGPFARDTVGVPEDAAFAAADWHVITLNGLRYTRYGSPRPLNEADRARLARIGVYQRVSVFAPREEADWPGHVYLLTAPGQFQPYESPHGGRYVCR